MKSRVKLFTIEPSAVGGACRELTVEGRKENFQPELMKCKELSDKCLSRSQQDLIKKGNWENQKLDSRAEVWPEELDRNI